MLLHPRTTAALGLTVLAAAVAPAAACADQTPPAHVPVAAGQLQHTVTVISFPGGGKNTFHHDGLRSEWWVTATAAREVVKNTTTHKVTSDCAYTTTVVRCWDAPLNKREPANGTIFIFPGQPILLQSWTDLGNNVKALLGDPRGYHQTGTTTYLGRDAVVLAQDAQRGPDGGIEHATVIAEADNYYPLFREDVDEDQPYHERDGRKGTERVDEINSTKVMEVISPNGVKLTMAPHRYAKVVDERKRHKPAPKRKGH
jgi:hypothetical protein